MSLECVQSWALGFMAIVQVACGLREWMCIFAESLNMHHYIEEICEKIIIYFQFMNCNYRKNMIIYY